MQSLKQFVQQFPSQPPVHRAAAIFVAIVLVLGLIGGLGFLLKFVLYAGILLGGAYWLHKSGLLDKLKK